MANFNAAYAFAQDNTVVIANKGGGKFNSFLRVKPKDEGNLCPDGGKGELAQWTAELQANGAEVKLKSNKTGKYLRIHNDSVDVGGAGGPFTVFKVHKQGQDEGGMKVKLESKKFAGKYIAVGQLNKVRVGAGGKWTELIFYRKPEPFTKSYGFGQNKTVVIEHGLGKFLRVKPKDQDNLDPDGGKGNFAQWEAEPQDGGKEVKLKSKASGKYLRIGPAGNINVGAKNGGPFTVFKVHKDGGKIKLESKKRAGEYIAVGKNNQIRVGKGGPFTALMFYKEN